MEGKYSLRSPAVKRLMREAKELHKVTELYYAQPLEDNLFEWHFTVRGPPDTEFAGGRYHGRIILPPEYPMKPPSIMLLTPNGRFEVGKKICLSMSAHHPETWQPSWSIRTVLMAIIGFMPTKGAGAIGALDYTPKERSILAKRSMEWKCSGCGSTNSNALLDEGSDLTETKETEKEIEELAGQIAFKEEDEKNKKKSKEENSTPPAPSPESASTGYPATPWAVGTSGMPNPWFQSTNQQPYMAYNPYYYGYPNFTGQMPPQPQMIGQNAMGLASNQNAVLASNQNAVLPQANQNTSTDQQAGGNQNTMSDSSGVRQRAHATQPPVLPQATSVPSAGIVARPRPSHVGMASLIITWFLAVSIIALVLRRLFMVQ